MGAKQSKTAKSIASQIAILSDLISAHVEAPLREDGFSLGTFELLSAIRASEGKVPQAELARRLGITAASLSEGLKLASKKGLIEQLDVPSDRRSKRVILTDKGQKVINDTLVRLGEIDDAMTQKLSKKNYASLIEGIEDCISALTKSKEKKK